MGYDFHLSAQGPRLIEINTNAGGAFLHAAAARAHRSCCEPMDRMFEVPAGLDRLDQVFIDMFRAEWRAQRGDAPLRSIAIVDDEPEQQYLAPEFEMARELFLAHGMHAVIADPRQLRMARRRALASGAAGRHAGGPGLQPADGLRSVRSSAMPACTMPM